MTPRIPRAQNLFSLAALMACATMFLGIAGRFLFLRFGTETTSAANLLRGLGIGVLFDLTLACYLFVPFALAGFLPASWWPRRWFQRTLFGIFVVEMGVVTLSAVCEGFFIDEFHARFNFIAVDYLVYTGEVVKNIFESYPMWWILPVLTISVLGASVALFRLFRAQKALSYPAQAAGGALALVLAVSAGLWLEESKVLRGKNPVEGEIAKNAVHALFAAYHNNEIDYHRFYRSLEESQASALVHEAFERDEPGPRGAGEDPTSIVRTIVRGTPPKKLNVVLVLMESMSARFLAAYGNTQGLTPNLDRLAREGLFLDHAYSTGTRTVRGIEAVVLSVPPTPGQSIVRRPDAGETFNLGTVFRHEGYQTQFVYGGHAFFDNMKEFFSSNGFEIADQGSMAPADIHFANAWGVSDEDLFDYSIKNADASFAARKPFFQFVLTTSNHRPYTYPAGRIDIPSHSGREGAVKYSDFAIGRFLGQAATKPWYKDTVFVFIADHNASVAGGTQILPLDYRIPIIFYAPAHIPPQRISLLSSQIDSAPTLLGLLNFSYQSRFFGHDLRHARTGRAFLGTYQKVGLWQNEQLVVLAPNRLIEVSQVKDEVASPPVTVSPAMPLSADLQEAIGYYQSASDWYGSQKLKEKNTAKLNTNRRAF